MALLYDDPRVTSGLLGHPLPWNPVQAMLPHTAPQAPSPHPSLQDRVQNVLGKLGEVFTGPADPRLSPEQNAAARKQALLQAGLGTILASGRNPNLLQSLAAGALTGQSANAQAKQGLFQRAHQQQLAQALSAAFPNGQVDRAGLERAFAAAIQSGDMDTAKYLSEILKSQGSQKGDIRAAVNPQTGKPELARIDPVTGAMQWLGAAPDTSANQPAARLETAVNPKTGKPELAWADPVSRALQFTGIEPPPAQPSLASQVRAGTAEFNRENAIRDDYRTEIKPIFSAYQFIDSALQNTALAKAGDAASRVQLLYAFVKAMDPNSAVREGEIQLVSAAAPLVGRVQRYIEDYAAGKSPAIPTELVDQMTRLMRQRMGQYETTWQSIYDNYAGSAERWGVDKRALRTPPDRYRSTKQKTTTSAGDVLSGYLK